MGIMDARREEESAAALTCPSAATTSIRKGRETGAAVAVRMPFPHTLHRMLDHVHQQGQTDIVAWNRQGTAFKVFDSKRFVRDILPIFFKQTKFKSFLRQLHIYGFARIKEGADRAFRKHMYFQRRTPQLDWIKPVRAPPKPSRRKRNATTTEKTLSSLPQQICKELVDDDDLLPDPPELSTALQNCGTTTSIVSASESACKSHLAADSSHEGSSNEDLVDKDVLLNFELLPILADEPGLSWATLEDPVGAR